MRYRQGIETPAYTVYIDVYSTLMCIVYARQLML